MSKGIKKVSESKKHMYEKLLWKSIGKEKVEDATASSKLVVKKCSCSLAMYIQVKGDDIVFIHCEPCITNLRFDTSDESVVVIKATRSKKRVRCNCSTIHLLSTFEDVKEVVSQ